MLEKARQICTGQLLGESSVNITKVLGKLDCRVALYLTNLQRKGFEGVEYASLQAIADAFNTDMRLLDPRALELKFSGREVPKTAPSTAPSTSNEAADVPVVRASATRSVEEMNSLLLCATDRKYKVGAFVKLESRKGAVWMVTTMSDDFCELIKPELLHDVDTETQRVSTQTLIDEWMVSSEKPQTQVIGLGICFY